MTKGRALDPTITKDVIGEFLKLKRMRFVNMGDPQMVYTYCLNQGLNALGAIVLEALKDPSDIRNSKYIEILKRHKAYANKYGLKE